MKVVILAGGFGSRISEESHLKPKPIIEVGDRPILWHIMKIYSSYGYNDFVICLGYKGYAIKEYFANYFLHQSNVTFDFRSDNKVTIHNHTTEPWRVTLVETGLHTMTGGRVRRIESYVKGEPFLLTYGDGVGNVNIPELVDFHRKNGKLATVTAVQPSGRYGLLKLDGDNTVNGFEEKPKGDGGWVNAGFFVMEPGIFKYIEDDTSVLERAPLENLAKDRQLGAFKHSGFWHPMDTMRDKQILENLWNSGQAPWRLW